jgi:general secretion pathway protein G
MHDQLGFTRWAVLVVMVIIGLLALAVGPRLFGDITLKEIATAKAQVAELGRPSNSFIKTSAAIRRMRKAWKLVKQPAAEAKGLTSMRNC